MVQICRDNDLEIFYFSPISRSSARHIPINSLSLTLHVEFSNCFLLGLL